MEQAHAPSWRAELWHVASSSLVVAGLVGVAWWGHATDWQFVPSRPTAVTVKPSPITVTGDTLTFPSADAVDAAGVEVAPVWTAPVVEAIPASGELLFDPARVARVSSRAGGACQWVLVAVGDAVKAGDTVALIDAADVGKAKADFLAAMVQVRLKRQSLANLSGGGAARHRAEAEAAVREADVKWRAAEQRLGQLGLPVTLAEYEPLTTEAAATRLRTVGVGEGSASANLLPVRTPLAGVVLAADAVAGEWVAAGQVAFTVVDPSRVWLTLHVAAEQADRVSVGQAATFRPDGATADVTGRVGWIAASADERTRTLAVRVELDNPRGELRAGVLGRGRIVVREVSAALVVPPTAVQRVGGRDVVFVRDAGYFRHDGPKAFHARAVRVGVRAGGAVELLAGVQRGEVVATNGAAVLADELKRGGRHE